MNIHPILLALTIGFVSCNADFSDHQEEIRQMEDSVFANFPTVNRVSVNVQSDFNKEIIITLGDKELYNASDAERNKVVTRTTEITQNIFKDRTPKKGIVIFVEEENTLHSAPDTEKKYPMNLPEK